MRNKKVRKKEVESFEHKIDTVWLQLTRRNPLVHLGVSGVRELRPVPATQPRISRPSDELVINQTDVFSALTICCLTVSNQKEYLYHLLRICFRHIVKTYDIRQIALLYNLAQG